MLWSWARGGQEPSGPSFPMAQKPLPPQSPDVPEGAIKSKSVPFQPVGAMRQLQFQLRQSLRFETFASLLACDPEDEDDSVPHIRVRAKRGNTT